jgi:hypothetical protein
MKMCFAALAISMVAMAPATAAVDPISLSETQKIIANSIIQDDVDSFLQGGDSQIAESLDAKFYPAQEIFDDYDANQVAADVKYLDKKVVVHGKIGSINSGLGNTPYVVFKIKSGFGGPQAHFSKENIPDVAKLKKGETVSLLCVASGAVVGTPMLKRCQPEEPLRSSLMSLAQNNVWAALTGKQAPKYASRIAILTLASDEQKITQGACATVGRKCAEAAVDTLKKMSDEARSKALDDAAKRIDSK